MSAALSGPPISDDEWLTILTDAYPEWAIALVDGRWVAIHPQEHTVERDGPRLLAVELAAADQLRAMGSGAS